MAQSGTKLTHNLSSFINQQPLRIDQTLTKTMHCEGALRNIEKEILRECAHRRIDLPSNFLNYYLKLLTLDPSWGISGKDVVDRGDVQKFIQHVVETFENQLTPSMVTLKMQFYYQCNFQQKQKIIKKNRAELLARLKDLEQDIVDVKALAEDDDIELMYKRMVFFIALASGLGNPAVENVAKEVRAALGSILDVNEMKEYATLSKHAKIENLMEFTKLVTGIRLFNKDCGKGGYGMDDLPKLINEALDATGIELQTSLISIMDKVNLMTTALDHVYIPELNERGKLLMVLHLPKGTSPKEVDFIKDSLIMHRQHELFIRKLIDEVDRIESAVSQIFGTLQSSLMDLHRVVKHRIAIPVNQVFPHFNKLSDIWCSLQDHTVLLAKVNQIARTLQKYVKMLPIPDDLAEVMLPSGAVALSDAERFSAARRERIMISEEDKFRSIAVIDGINFENAERIKLEYLGFCAWKTFMTEGALLPGNPNLGVVKAVNMNFVFAAREAGEVFMKMPEKCIMEMVNLARRRPELISLLGLKERLILLRNFKELIKEPPLLPLTAEVEMQTLVHPVETNIDKDYLWNIWDHKRRAILLANLSHCKTVACQTEKSYSRGNLQTQTYEQKDKELQTMKSEGTNVPKPSTFIFGLRGRKDNKQFIVDLTRPVDE